MMGHAGVRGVGEEWAGGSGSLRAGGADLRVGLRRRVRRPLLPLHNRPRRRPEPGEELALSSSSYLCCWRLVSLALIAPPRVER